MKKINILLVSIFTVLVGTFLSACNFKTESASFTQDEISVSVGDEINLADYIEAKEVDKNDITFKFSNSALFLQNSSVLTANSFGQSVVYATYDGNTLDSMRIVVRKPFEQVTNITMDDLGLVTWNNVVDKFDETENFTSPSQYKIHFSYVNMDTQETREYDEFVNTNSYQLVENGRYTLTFYAVGEGKFDDSLPASVTVYFGYMPKLAKSDFTFDVTNNTLTWSNVSDACYSVEFNGQVISEKQAENSINLTENLASLEAGEYSLNIIVHDKNEEKISVKSEDILINKLVAPVGENLFDETSGGRFQITAPDNFEKVEVKLGEEFSFDFNEKVSVTTFEGVTTGKYMVTAKVFAEESDTPGVFYADSDIVNLGYIYKLDKLTLQGTGNNAVDATSFNFDVNRTFNEVTSKVKVVLKSGETVEKVENGFSNYENTLNKNVDVAESGIYNLSVFELAGQETINFENDDCFVINSDESDLLNFVKLDAFSNFAGDEAIVHAYEAEKSTLQFNLVESTSNYSLLVKNAEEFETVEPDLYSYENGKFTFNGKIENLFSDYINSNEITFKIVAENENKQNSISSSAIKTLTVLETPTSDGGNIESDTYSFNSVAGADDYFVRYAIIDKVQYSLGVDGIETESLSFTETTISETSLTLDAGNYYYIEIAANPENESLNLTSNTFKAVFFLSKELDTPVVSFGYDESYQGAITDASGYFLKVNNVENMESLTVVNGASQMTSYSTGENETIYLFTDNFSAETSVDIMVTAHSNDSTIYLDSETYTLTVTRLKSIQYADLIFDELTKNMTVKGGIEGVTNIRIFESDTNKVERPNIDTVLDISKITNSTVTVNLYGSKLEDKLFEVVDDKVYLDSATSTFNLRRLERPTEFSYKDGNLTFVTDRTRVEYFVLDMFLVDVNNNQKLLKVNLTSPEIDVDIYDVLADEIALIQEDIKLTGEVLSGDGTFEIDFNTLLSLIKENETLNTYYSQAVKVEFSLYSYQTMLSSYIYLSSYNATLKSDAGLDRLTVEKMASPVIAYEKSTSNLTWQAVGEESAETVYVVYDISSGERVQVSSSNATAYNVDLSLLTLSTDYKYVVVATNPYYLESGESNEILIHKLSPINSVKLADNKIQFSARVEDVDFVKHASLVIDENPEIEISNFEHTITTDGTYNFKFVATDSLETSGKYYIDSSVTTYLVNSMSTIAPSDDNVKFQDNTVSFEKFGQDKNLQSLRYIIVFSDASNNMVQIPTTENTYTIDQQSDLNPLNNLTAGDIKIEVYAVLDPYNISANGEIYYGEEISLSNGEKMFNAFKYTSDKVITKLTTPTISNIEFVEQDNAQRPTMKIHVNGNYSSNEKFLVFIGNTDVYVKEVDCATAMTEENTYEIDLAFSEFSDYLPVGEETEIYIYVISSNNLPSSYSSAAIYRNKPLLSIEQNSNADQIGYVQRITFTFESEEALQYATGGITLNINYTSGEETKTATLQVPTNSYVDANKITYDLTSFFGQNMASGGSLSYSAFVNNFNGNGKYYLSSESIESQAYNVLESPENYLNKLQGGVEIGGKEDGSLINSTETKYIITKGSERYEITLNDEGKFYFEYPTTWENGNHSYTIVAIEDGMINSNFVTVSLDMERLDKVTNITFKRDASLQAISLSWDAVVNADNYIIRAYVTGEQDTLINEFETSLTSFLMSNVFGENFEKLSGYISLGANIRFDIIASNSQNTNYNNSSIQYVYAEFLANNITVLDFNVGEDGQLYFPTEIGKDYMYRVVDVSGTEYLSWQTITAVADSYVLDLTGIEALTSANTFRVQVITVGNATTAGTIYNDDTIKLIIDSAYVASENTFMLSPTAHEVRPNEIDASGIYISLEDQSSVIYASLNSKYDYNQVVKLDIDYSNIVEENGYYLYNMDYTGIFDMFNVETTTKIYFFSYKSGEEANYVISKPFEYEFKVESTTEYSGIEKITSGDNVDLVNSYITVDRNTQNNLITAFYIKILYTAPGGETQTFKYMYSGVNFEYNLFENKIGINVTTILNDNDVDNGVGTYKLYISNIKVENQGTQDDPIYVTYFSPYVEMTKDGEEFLFTKLPEMTSVYLNNGDLYWTYDENYLEQTTKYYIYYRSISNTNDYNKYETTSNTQISFSGLLFAGSTNAYNISVRPVSEDAKIIAGNEKYVADSEGTPINVVKNRFNNPLKLSSTGTLYVDWKSQDSETTTDHDIYKLLTQETITTEMANDFVNETFYYPFTFNISDLTYGNTRVRFRFTSYLDDSKETISYRRSVDINAIYLLGILDIGNDTFLQKIDEISKLLVDSAEQNLVKAFSDTVMKRMGGIGSYINIFDDFFELIQEGKYEIEYCLLGNSSTLTSVWYTLTQDDGSKDFYVNSTPKVNAGVTKVSEISNEYFVKLRESEVYGKDGTKMPATTYYLQMKNSNETKKYGFEISTQDSGATWNLKMTGNDEIAAYNIDKEVGSDGYNYLVIYFNLHNGNSIKSKYNEYVKDEDFAFEIYAQGNSSSLSSKSTRFTISFYNACDDFKIEDGEFSWISYLNNDTKIVYKAENDASEKTVVVKPEVNKMSYFSLEGLSTGRYEYIKFVTLGKVEGNVIRVDSEVYTVSNVYKLIAPTLSADLNLIAVDDSNNEGFYELSYSDNEFNRFNVYNDVSTSSLSYTFSSGEQVALYEPGITNYLTTDVDYAYKATEETATKFNFLSLGSTASFNAVLDVNDISNNTYNFKVVGKESEDVAICVMSTVKEISASMLNPVTNILVSNGIITWSDVDVLGENTYDEENYDLVYKVTLTFYDKNNSSSGTTNDTVGESIVSYTAKTSFDTSKVEDMFPVEINYLKITIQAMVLQVFDAEPSGNYVSLIEGGYAEGKNILYSNVRNYILISNGATASDIQFSAPVTNLRVEDGKIKWDYQGNGNFTVEDSDGNSISGQITANGETYTFTPDNNALSFGDHEIVVYANSTDGYNIVKSKGVKTIVHKLYNFGEDGEIDYEIYEDTRNNTDGEAETVEILDFTKYFEKNSAEINVTLTISYMDADSILRTFEITKENCKVVITSSPDVIIETTENVLSVIDVLSLTVEAKGEYADGRTNNILNADQFILDLERPENNYVISWDETKDIFSWALQEGAEELRSDEDIVFVVTVRYNHSTFDNETRKYELTGTEFMPTVISNVSLDLAIKFGSQGLISKTVSYKNEIDNRDYARFDLFESGSGTQEDPYVISNENHFTNMQYRMTKPSYLTSYTDEDGLTQTEPERFYFNITNGLNITFNDDQGIYFKGDFEGVIQGNSNLITYTSKAVEALTNYIDVRDGTIKSLESGQSSTRFSYGIGLFESLSSNASISNLIIKPNFTSAEIITQHVLVAGLVINNRGTITNVSVNGMTSNLVIYRSTQSLIGAYSGIASINSGTISSCNITGDIALTDTNAVGNNASQAYAQNFFIGGICYTNYREIRNCILEANITLTVGSNMMTTHQIAGISVTSTETGTLANNQIATSAGETYKVTITCTNSNQCRAYVAGLAVYGKGSISGNTTNEGCAVANNVTEAHVVTDIYDGI